MIEKGAAEVLEVITNSIHRNTLPVLGEARKRKKEKEAIE